MQVADEWTAPNRNYQLDAAAANWLSNYASTAARARSVGPKVASSTVMCEQPSSDSNGPVPW